MPVNDFRKYYHKITSNNEFNLDIEDPSLQDKKEEISDETLSSVVFDLFTKKKESPTKDYDTKSTHASNFRIRFTKNESLFSLFFSYGEIQSDPEVAFLSYKVEGWKRDRSNKKIRTDFRTTVDEIRYKHYNKTELYQLHKQDDYEIQKLSSPQKYDTLFSILWKRFSVEDKNRFSTIFNSWSSYQKEGFLGFIQRGILLASEALIDLYCWFIEAEGRKSQGDSLYKKFCSIVSSRVNSTVIPHLVLEAANHFEIFCEKVLTEKAYGMALVNQKWNIFYGVSPIYGYTGSTKNTNILKAFNSPFYPINLVSTSVLQEGVNLQYYCDNVIHYGISWTSGDNEQRVGRVDRMFSLTERKLDMDENASLNIDYPFIAATLDEDQLGAFIHKKYIAERLLDECKNVTEDKALNIEKESTNNWKDYLRTPSTQVSEEDPYFPVEENPFPIKASIPNSGKNLYNLQSALINSFKETNFPIYLWQEKEKYETNSICLVNATINNRQQPIICSIKHSQELTALAEQVSYILQLSTPIAKNVEIPVLLENLKNNKKVSDTYYEEFPNVKLCIDDELSDSWFKCYMRVDFPIFPNLEMKAFSKGELLQSFEDLISCADYIEKIVFQRDLTIDKISEGSILEKYQTSTEELLRDNTLTESISEEWTLLNNKYIQLNAELELDQKNIYILNHNKPLLKFNPSSIQLSLLSLDIQEIEAITSECYFNLIRQNFSNM